MGLSRRAAIVASGRVATTGSILVVNALMARAWVPDLFGQFSTIWVLGNTLVPFFLMGIPGALLYTLPRRESPQRGALLVRSTVVLAASALVLCLVLWIASPLIALSVDGLTAAQLGDSLISFLPYVFCLVAGGHIEAALVASGRPMWQAVIAWLGAVVLIGSASGAYVFNWSVELTFAALSAAGLARLLIAYVALGRVGRARGPNVGMSDFLRYAITIGASEGVGSLSRSVDRLVVLLFLDPSRMGIYHLGAIEVPVSLVLASLVTVMVPEVSRLMAAGDIDQVADLFRTAVVRLSWLILPLFFYLFVFTDDVMRLYLPPAYGDSANVFRCFLLILPLRCAIYNPILVGSGRANWALFGSLADLVVNTMLSVGLVLWLREAHPSLAMLGPAVATVSATYLQVLVLLLAISHLLSRSVRHLLPWAHLLRVSAFAAATATGAYWVLSALIHGAGTRLLLGSVIMVCGAWGMPALLFREDRREITALLRAVVRPERGS